MNVSYLMPTRVFIERDCIKTQGAQLGAWGKKAVIVTGKHSAKACGALKDVCDVLNRQSIPWIHYDGILPNPSIENVREAAAMARTHGADMVIGIGGGSPMDAAKAVAVLIVNDLADEDLFKGPYPVSPLPVIAVPTTAGTGSEVTPYSILTDVKDQTKKNLSHPGLFPKLAFLDARYLEALPREVTVNTALDALSHAVESHLSARNHPMSAMFALESIKELGPCLKHLAGHGTPDPSIREKLLYGSMLAGVAIAQTGTTMVHAMGYSLTFFHHVDHGRANAVLLCEAMRFCHEKNKDKIKVILKLLDVESIQAMQDLFTGLIGKPGTISQDDMDLFTEKAMQTKSIDNTVPKPTARDIRMIYEKALNLK